MTTTATSASDRIEAAREALADYDGNETNYRAIPVNEQGGRHQEYYENAIFDNAHVLATTLRALIEPPATSEHPLRIAEGVARSHRTDYSTAGWSCECGHKYASVTGHEIEDHRMAEAVVAGIQAAWSDWEPEGE